MMIRRINPYVAALIIALPVTLALAQSKESGGLTAQEKRGKQIYIRGTSASGKPIAALLGSASFEVPASAMACANCHGYDGKGKPEGGVLPSNITWANLTKPYGLSHATGRESSPYNERLLARAIKEGLDPSANRLLTAMPRYVISDDDASDLIAYVKKLGRDADPGVSGESIRIGTLLPASGPFAEVAQTMKAVIEAHFAEINEGGGIYSRKIELVAEQSEDRSAQSLKRFIEREPVFAMAASVIAGKDRELALLSEAEEVPLVGPLTFMPDEKMPPDRHVFYLFSGFNDQSRAMVRYVVEDDRTVKPRLVIIHTGRILPEGPIPAIEAECRRLGLGAPKLIESDAARGDRAVAAALAKHSGADAVFFFGPPGDLKLFLKQWESLGWFPKVFLPGSTAGGELFDAPASFKGKIFLSFPTVASDHTQAGVAEFLRLSNKYNLPRRHLPAQVAAYCASKVLVEGLKLAGRDLSREKFLSSLERIYRFDTGLTQPVTYGPNRRIGALGAYVVMLDLDKRAFSPGRWVDLN